MFQSLISVVALAAAITGAAAFHAGSLQDRSRPSKIDLSSLIDASGKVGGAMHQRLSNYTYTWQFSWRAINSKGSAKEGSRTYEVFVPDLKRKYGKSVKFPLILIARNGVPLPANDLEKARLKAGVELEKSESEKRGDSGEISAERYVNYTGAFENVKVRLSLSEILSGSDFALERIAQVNDRPTLILDFIPQKDALLDRETAYLSKLRGKLWVDQADKAVIGMAAWPRDVVVSGDYDQILSQAVVAYEQLRTKEGDWLPRRVRFNGGNYPFLFGGKRADIEYLFKDYIMFKVESEKEQIR